MTTVAETIENDDLYCRFIRLIVVNSRKWNVWLDLYHDRIL